MDQTRSWLGRLNEHGELREHNFVRVINRGNVVPNSLIVRIFQIDDFYESLQCSSKLCLQRHCQEFIDQG